MYYKLRCNSTQFVIYYKLRNYYKLQRNSADQKYFRVWKLLIEMQDSFTFNT